MKPHVTILIGVVAAVLMPLASRAATDAAPPSAPELVIPANLKLSQPARDVEKMAASGVSQDVIKTYIDSSPYTFSLSADNIIYMQGAGVPGGLTSEMLTHDKNLAAQAAGSQPPFSTAPPPSTPYPYPYPAPGEEAPAQPANPVSTYTIPADTDYSGLAPYGSWGYLPDYGWCWQPSFGLGYAYYPWGILRYGNWWNCPGRGWVWFPGRGFRGAVGGFGGRGFVGNTRFVGGTRFGGGGFANRSVSVTRIGGASHFAGGGFARGGGGAHFSGGHSGGGFGHTAASGGHR